MDIGDVTVCDDGVGGIQTNSALYLLRRKSVNPHAIECQVMWHACESRLSGVAESNQIVNEICGRDRGDVETDQFVVMSAGGGFNDRVAGDPIIKTARSEEHTSELQSH